MITYDIQIINPKRAKFSFKGLTTDEKPVGSYKGSAIANGSTYLEMDTHTIYFYDEEGQKWD